MAVVTVAAAAVLAGTVTALSLATAGGARHLSAGAQGGGARGSSPAAPAASATARKQAAFWVSHQVSRHVIVACDPAVCEALRRQGIAGGRLRVLRPGQPGLLGSGVVLASGAVREEFGGRLASVYAPVTLAHFGAGPARIDIRVVAVSGSAAYESALAADVRARAMAGAQLAHDPSIHASAAVRRQLGSGEVDARLLVTLARLASEHPVAIVRFISPPGQLVSARVPLRSAAIFPVGAPASAVPSLSALRRFLLAQRPPYHPLAVWKARIRAHRSALGLKYPAPSPLGLLASHGVSPRQ